MSNTTHKSDSSRILITGAAGNIGAIGPKVVQALLNQGHNVRAMVRKEDDRAESLRQLGAEVVIGDLTRSVDVLKALSGCNRVYFSMTISEYYLEATIIMAAAAREIGNIEVLVNMSQMTVSEMDLTHMTNSRQQRLHWYSEQALNWSGLPVVHIRPTVFLDSPFFSYWAAQSVKTSGQLRLPFGHGRSSPIATEDVAAVVATVLHEPSQHIGKTYHLTGRISQDFNAIAKAYAEALGRDVEYVDVPFEEWGQQVLSQLPKHTQDHLQEMALLHSQNRYDRTSMDVKLITGKEPMSIQEFIERRPNVFQSKKPQL